jgi:hypothetical protein
VNTAITGVNLPLNQNQIMKTKFILPVLLLSAMIASCGPNADEQAAEDKRMADSVASAAAAKKAAEEAALAQDAIQDSLLLLIQRLTEAGS